MGSWQFTLQVRESAETDEHTMHLTPIPGTLALSTDDAKHCLMTFMFLGQLLADQPNDADATVQVELILLGKTAWKGHMALQKTCSWIAARWTRTCRMFQVKMDLRFLIAGKQVNPGWPIQDYMTDQMKHELRCRIHTVLELRGGGPITLTPNAEACEEAAAASIPPSGNPLDREIDIFYLAANHFQDALVQVIKEWLMLPGQQTNMDTTKFLPLTCKEEPNMIIWEAQTSLLLDMVKSLKQVGAELMLTKMGWMVTVQYVAFEDPPITRILLLPHPSDRSVSKSLVIRFLQIVLFRFALPKPGLIPHDSCRVRIRAEGAALYNSVLAADTRCSDITDAWEQASTILNIPGVIRLVINGRQASPEFLLADYVRVGPSGDQYAHIVLVHPQHGGGPHDDTAEVPSDTKSMLATFLLQQGAKYQDVFPFTQALSKAGVAPLANILQNKDKKSRIQMIRKLALSMQLDVPELHVKHNMVKKKVQERMPNPNNVDLTQIHLKEKFFQNNDGSTCGQREAPSPGEAGIAILSPKEAVHWLGQTISADEQAMVVIGNCPCKGTGQTLQLPAYYQGEPVLFNSCLHQLGKKPVVVETIAGQAIPTANTCVVAVTVFRDELTAQQWQQIEQAPVKTAFGILFHDSEPPPLACPPWGRTFQDQSGRNTKLEAMTFQFHCRIDQADLKRVLRASGRKGAYTTPKTEQRSVCQQFQVVWMTLDHVQITVAASSMDKSLGIVRNSRPNAKISRGIRFDREDFQKAFEELKPGEELPSQVPSKVLFKVSPVPIGAKHADVQAWITSNNWIAKPIRALSAGTWLCGCEKAFDTDFATWSQQTIVVKWIQQKPNHQPWILAGSLHQTKLTSKAKSEAKELPPLSLDPWNNYKPIELPPKGAAQMPQTITRKLEAPIEDRFSAQQQDLEKIKEDTTKQISEIKEQMREMQSNMKETRSDMATHQKAVQDEFKTIRAESQKQFHDLSTIFSESLATALGKQDKVISNQMSELKLLIQGRPAACKKAKVTKPGENPEDAQDDSQL